MIEPIKPDNEMERLEEIRTLGLVNGSYKNRFDAIAKLTKSIFDVPVAFVSVVEAENQHFISNLGLVDEDGEDIEALPRNTSFCGHTILSSAINYIKDATTDERFADNPLVIGHPNIRLYLGYPIKSSAGIRVGCLCVLDNKPREFSESDLENLHSLGELIERELHIYQLATVDDLTLLLNRRGFLISVNYAIQKAKRKATSMCFLSCDLNKFKLINDTYGHAEGDVALNLFADVLRTSFRSIDILARLGGDEFMVLLTDIALADVEAMVDRFWANLEQANIDAGKPYNVAASVGISHFESDAISDVEAMIAHSDKAMYSHKNKNNNVT